MKSRLLSLYDYTKISMEIEPIVVTQMELDSEAGNDMEALRMQHTRMESADTVEKGDICTLMLESTNPRYCKESLALNVGLGLFQPQLEEALIGHGVGDSLEIAVGEDAVKAVILSCRRKTVPREVTDEMVQTLQLEGVSTVEEYRRYLHRWYLDFYRHEYTYIYYAQQLFSEVCEKSTWEMDGEEVEKYYQKWHRCNEEEQEFHGMEWAESYPGEIEEMEREDSLMYLRLALVDCRMQGADAADFELDFHDRQALEQMGRRVWGPLGDYLADKVIIEYKEEE